MIAYSSSKKPLNGVGDGSVGTPSTSTRTGSFSVATHAASSRPGMPTAMTAACQQTRPKGPPPSHAPFQPSTMKPPTISENPPPKQRPAEKRGRGVPRKFQGNRDETRKK